jgi:hypothetical protein
VGSVVLSSLSFATLVGAQQAGGDGPAGAASAAAPDVVRLKNGSLLRGTINELLAGESVTIVTVAGKTREFPMSEVEYAGPADRDPVAAAARPANAAAAPPPAQDAETALSGEPTKVRPYVTRQGKEAQLRLTSQPEGLTFHRQTGSAIGGQTYATGYDRLCTAPCDIALPAGTEVLALSKGNEPPRIAEPISFPAGKSRIVGSLESRAGTRIAGWTIVGASVVVGAVLVFSSISSTEVCGEDSGLGDGRSCHTETDVSFPLLLTGAVLPAVGIPVGIILGVRRDTAKVELARSRPSEALPTPGLTLRTVL